jgi:hypothetical protein
MSSPAFERLSDVYRLAAKAQVGFTLTYGAGCESWEFSVLSPVQTECFASRDYQNFDIAVDAVLEHLTGIST